MNGYIYGKRLHALLNTLGIQRATAEYSGLALNRLLVMAFVIAAMTAVVGGLISAANIRMFTPLAGFTYLLDAIAAVFIGAALNPLGRPSVPSTIVAVLFLTLIANGLNLAGLPFATKDAVSGAILVAALALAITQRRWLTSLHPSHNPSHKGVPHA